RALLYCTVVYVAPLFTLRRIPLRPNGSSASGSRFYHAPPPEPNRLFCSRGQPPTVLRTQGILHCLRDSTPYGIRTRAAALKGRCPRPLDEGGLPRRLGKYPQRLSVGSEESIWHAAAGRKTAPR